jgi:hypothetical protein
MLVAKAASWQAEEVLAKLPRLGIPMILRAPKEGPAKPFGMSTMQHIVQPKHARCLPIVPNRATPATRSALRPRMLSATRKRHAHRLANEIATDVQNAMGESVQNEKGTS